MSFWYETQHVERRNRDLVGIPPINDRPYNVANDPDLSTFSIALLCSEISSLELFCMLELRHPGEGLSKQAKKSPKKRFKMNVRRNSQRSTIQTMNKIIIDLQYSKSSLFSRFALRIMRAS